MRHPKLGLAAVFALACSQEPSGTPSEPCAAVGVTSAMRFEGGSVDGHADPFGAKAAGQARAGRVRDGGMIVQGADAKARVVPGDYVLANDKIAIYVAGARVTDGYVPFGGEIVSLDAVGDDGRPLGIGRYEETLIAFSRQSIAAESVSVLADGADGGAAVVRVSGVLTNVPLLEILGGLLRDEYDFPVALDYVLEPGAEKVSLRMSLANIRDEEVEFLSKEIHGFLQAARAQLFTIQNGYDSSSGPVPYVAFDGGDFGFAWRLADRSLASGIDVASFQYYSGKDLALDACEKREFDYVEIIAGGPQLDGVLAAVRRVDGDTSHRPVHGKIVEATGEAIADAFVIATDEGRKVLSRTRSGADGRFSIHVPAGAKLEVWKSGYASPEPIAAPEGEAEIVMPPRGTLLVRAIEAGTSRALPVRVQVIPTAPGEALPASFGIAEPAHGRIHLAFPERGIVSLPVPPGEHRVIVSRGYEYEIDDRKVVVEAGRTSTVDAVLERSVDSTGVMCADFHIHTFYSPDGEDTVELKVRSAVADGLEIPVASDHEYVIDFQPTIEALGLREHAFGVPSLELSTWTFGHFGVVPKLPVPDLPNRGAIDWVGRNVDELFRSVRELPEKPVLIVNHPHMLGFNGYFTVTSFSTDRAAGEGERWSDAFDVIEVFNESDFEENRAQSVASWFSILNAGRNVWAVGSSDSHRVRSQPVGYPRTCFPFGHDDPTRLTHEAVRDVLAAGRGVVSGGLFMTVSGPDGKGPGETSTAGAYQVVVQSPTYIEAKTLEVIVDGETVRTIELTPATKAGAGHRYEATVDVTSSSSRPRHWVVFHARGPDGVDLAPLHPGKTPFAVSNPIFF